MIESLNWLYNTASVLTSCKCNLKHVWSMAACEARTFVPILVSIHKNWEKSLPAKASQLA